MYCFYFNSVIIVVPWINTGFFYPSSSTAQCAENFEKLPVAELGCLFDVAALLVLGL